MEIQLTKKYLLKSDKSNVWIEDEKAFPVSGYCRTVTGALKQFAATKTRGSDARTVEELLKDVCDVENEVSKMIKSIEKFSDTKLSRV